MAIVLLPIDASFVPLECDMGVPWFEYLTEYFVGTLNGELDI